MNYSNAGTLVIKEASKHQSGIFNDFIHLPYQLYRDDPCWVPPLLSEEKRLLSKKSNPFLKRNTVVFYVCYKNGVPVGRIAGIINLDHNNHHNDHTAFFGFFEAIDDDAVARLLFQAVTQWVADRGADSLRGPTNFTLNDVSGLLIDGYNQSPFIMMPYNPDYYQELYRKNGFDVAMRFFAYDVTAKTIKFPAFLDRLEGRLEEKNIKIRNFDFNCLDRDFKIAIDIFNLAWRDNWGFTPVSFEEAVEDFRRVKVFARPELTFIAEHNGEPVGFAIALPDINQALKPLRGRLLPFNWFKLIRGIKKINQIRVLLMGIVDAHRKQGIDLMFYKKIMDYSLQDNYRRAELSWILENNRMMNRVLEHINARKNKIYAIFEKQIEPRD